MIFQTQIISFKRSHSLKYLRSTTFGSKDIVIRKSEFVTKTQFLFSESYNYIINFDQLRNFKYNFCRNGKILKVNFSKFKNFQTPLPTCTNIEKTLFEDNLQQLLSQTLPKTEIHLISTHKQ